LTKHNFVFAGSLWCTIVSTIGILLPSLLFVFRFGPDLDPPPRAALTHSGFVDGAHAEAIGKIVGASVLLGRITIGVWLPANVGSC